MRMALMAAAAAALIAGAAHAGDYAEVDQIAQQKMIGLPAKAILTCMGQPARKLAVGSSRIWTYPSGSAAVDAGPFSLGVNGMASFLGGDGFCNVNVVLTNATVSQIYYTAPDDGPLRLGEQCIFAVRACAELHVVRATY